MRQIDVTLKGVAPVRFNKFSEEAKDLMATQGSVVKTKERFENEWKARLYEDENGLYAPSKWIKASLVRAGKLKKVGRKSCSEWVNSVVFVNPDRISFGKKEVDGTHEDVVRIPPVTGSRCVKRWGVIIGWEIQFTLDVMDDSLHPEVLKEILGLAGLRYGIGDGRPTFGRFEVTGFSERSMVR